MATMSYFEEPLYAPGNDGLADTKGKPTVVEVVVSSFFANHQIFLRLKKGPRESDCENLHLTKEQAFELAEALDTAARSIGYDNTVIPDEDE